MSRSLEENGVKKWMKENKIVDLPRKQKDKMSLFCYITNLEFEIGVEYFEKENIHSISGDGELMLTILASFAQEESRSVSENCKWRIRKGFLNGELVNLRFMYGYNIDDGEITINEEEAEIVRMIFNDYFNGMGTSSIAKKLNLMKVKRLRGGKWNSERVAEILRNEKYIGDALLQKKYVEDHLTKTLVRNKGDLPQYYVKNSHHAIIDKDIFEKVQYIMEERRNKFAGKNTHYPFTSKLICENCGKKYRRKLSHGKVYWVCSTYTRYGKDYCNSKQIPEEILLEITSEILEVDNFDETLFAVQSANDTNVEIDRGEIQKEINQLTSEINRIGNTTEFNTMKLLNGDRAITFDPKTVVTSKTYDINSAPGITNTAGAGKVPTFMNGETADQINIETTDDIDWTKLDTAATNTITVSKDGDNLKVAIAAKEDTTAKELSVTDEYATLKDGFYEYNAHGVSFKISEEDFAAMATDTKVEVDLSAVAGTGTDVTGAVGTKTSWTTNTDGTGLSDAAITDGIKIDGSLLPEDARSLKVGYDGAAYTVTISDAGGVALSTDKITTTGDLKYNNHGVSFALTQTDATSLALNLDLDTEVVKDGTLTSDKSLSFQVGANENQAMSLDINDMRAVALGISSAKGGDDFAAGMAVTDGTDNTAAEYALDVSTHEKAASAVTTINTAIETVSAERSKLGAMQNRLEHTIKNLDTSSENLQAAESRIRDIDMAKEMMEFTKQNILQQAATAMLAQANQAPQTVLQLLR